MNFSPEISKCTMPTEMKRNSALDTNKYTVKTEACLMSERAALGSELDSVGNQTSNLTTSRKPAGGSNSSKQKSILYKRRTSRNSKAVSGNSLISGGSQNSHKNS
jgi:hypothetical protein